MSSDLKRKRSSAKGKFHRIYNRLMPGIQNNEGCELLTQVLEDLEKAYTGVEISHDLYIETLDPESEEQEISIKTLEEDINVMYNELCEARSAVTKISQEYLKVKREREELRDVETTSNSDAAIRTRQKVVQLKKLEAPTFSNNIRDYPSFKRDYNKHIVPLYGKDLYSLKNCLNGEALQLVKAVYDDYDEIMKILDFKYGRPEKLVIRSLLRQLISLKGVI